MRARIGRRGQHAIRGQGLDRSADTLGKQIEHVHGAGDSKSRPRAETTSAALRISVRLMHKLAASSVRSLPLKGQGDRVWLSSRPSKPGHSASTDARRTRLWPGTREPGPSKRRAGQWGKAVRRARLDGRGRCLLGSGSRGRGPQARSRASATRFGPRRFGRNDSRGCFDMIGQPLARGHMRSPCLSGGGWSPRRERRPNKASRPNCHSRRAHFLGTRADRPKSALAYFLPSSRARASSAAISPSNQARSFTHCVVSRVRAGHAAIGSDAASADDDIWTIMAMFDLREEVESRASANYQGLLKIAIS